MEQSIYESEFPPSTADTVPLPPKGTAHLWLLLRSRWGRCVGWGAVYLCKRVSPLCPFGTSLPQGRDYFLYVRSACVCYLQGGRLFLGLLLCSRWGVGGCLCFLIFAVVQKIPLLKRSGIFDIGFQYLHTVIHLGNCSGNYLVNATPTYWPAPFWRPVTLKPRASPTKRTGT